MGDFMTNSIQSFVPDPLYNISNKEALFKRYPSNSEVNASEIVENLDEMFPLYYHT